MRQQHGWDFSFHCIVIYVKFSFHDGHYQQAIQHEQVSSVVPGMCNAIGKVHDELNDSKALVAFSA